MPKLPKPFTPHNWLEKAKLEFTNGTGFESPEEVVREGKKTPIDWCETIDKHRPSNAREGFHLEARR